MSDFNSLITTVDRSGTTALHENAGERLSVENDQIKSQGSFLGRVLRTVANIFSLGIYGLVKDAQVKTAFQESLKNAAATAQDPNVKSLINRAVQKLESSNVVGVTGNVANHFKEVVGRDDWDGLRKVATADTFRSKFSANVDSVKEQVRGELGTASGSPNIKLESNEHGRFALAQLASLNSQVESILSNPLSTLDDVESAYEKWEAGYNEAYEKVEGLHDAGPKYIVKFANEVKSQLKAFVQGSGNVAENDSSPVNTGVKITLTSKH